MSSIAIEEAWLSELGQNIKNEDHCNKLITDFLGLGNGVLKFGKDKFGTAPNKAKERKEYALLQWKKSKGKKATLFSLLQHLEDAKDKKVLTTEEYQFLYAKFERPLAAVSSSCEKRVIDAAERVRELGQFRQEIFDHKQSLLTSINKAEKDVMTYIQGMKSQLKEDKADVEIEQLIEDLKELQNTMNNTKETADKLLSQISQSGSAVKEEVAEIVDKMPDLMATLDKPTPVTKVTTATFVAGNGNIVEAVGSLNL